MYQRMEYGGKLNSQPLGGLTTTAQSTKLKQCLRMGKLSSLSGPVAQPARSRGEVLRRLPRPVERTMRQREPSMKAETSKLTGRWLLSTWIGGVKMSRQAGIRMTAGGLEFGKRTWCTIDNESIVFGFCPG